MDGNLYNYAPNHMWNGYSDGFQPPPLELQNYMPTNREHFPREQSKNPLVPPAPPYVFFNYPEEPPHYHNHHPENMNRNQWHFPAWPKMKVRPESVFQEAPKRYTEKHFHKNCGIGVSLVHQGPSNLNIPAPGGYYSTDASDHMMDDIHRIGSSLDILEPVNINIPVTASNVINHPVLESTSSHRSISKKNPVSKKRREKPKKEVKSAKKRTRDEEKWARNIRKKARSKGESYVSVQGKTIPARSVKEVDCSKCKFNCPTRVPEAERQKLFKEYWDLQSFKEKVDYITGCIHEFAPLRPMSGRRSYSRRYMLKVNGKDERVCKEFFVTTFDISESTIVTYMAKKRKGPEAIADLRGKQTPSNKTPDSTVRIIREHILSQIGLQGELTRSPCEDVKNVKKLYQHYQAECEQEKVRPASISVYRKVYSDMHRDKNDTPVVIPPDNVLMLSKKNKRLKSIDKGDSNVSDSYREEEDVDPFESSISPGPNTSSNSLPPVQEATTSSSSAAVLDMPPASDENNHSLYSYQGSNGQNLITNAQPDKKMYSLNIPQTVQQPHNNFHNQHIRQHPIPPHQQHHEKTMFALPYQGDPSSSNHERGHTNNILPFLWDSGRIGSSTGISEHELNYHPSTYSNQNHLIQPPPSALSSSLFNYRISSSSASTTAPLPVASTSNAELKIKSCQASYGKVPVVKTTKGSSKSKKIKDKPKKETKKRTRNEDSWGRNVRKRLRFKGEAYTSVRGKQVEAKRVKEVDCSECKFKCTSRITKEQQERLNQYYWSLESYKKKIEFLTKYVETYTPKRKMTGRRAFSRKYTFDIEGNEERVCKDFFKATLHISESTIATALEKSRKGPEAIVDMRGKHKPVNKTTEETLQNIRELIIYLTGMRPHRSNNNQLGPEYKDINRLYQVYKYDSEKKGKKLASLGIFRNVLIKEFCIKSPKAKKGENSEDFLVQNGTCTVQPAISSSSSEAWSISLPQPCSNTELLPKPVSYVESQFTELNIPNM